MIGFDMKAPQLVYHYTGCAVAFGASVIAQASTNAQAQGAGVVTSVCALVAILIPAWLADRKDKREKDTRLFQIQQENTLIKREAECAKIEALEAKKENSKIRSRMDRYDVTKVQIDSNTEKITENRYKTDVSTQVLFDRGYLRKPINIPKAIRILVVEDNVDLAKALTKMLVGHDFIVDYANNIEQAIKELQVKDEDIFDWIILDLNLEDGDGESIAQYIHQHNIETKIAITTGVMNEERVKAIKADKIFLKPFDFNDLIDTLSFVEKEI